jgi:hypothetical protein
MRKLGILAGIAGAFAMASANQHERDRIGGLPLLDDTEEDRVERVRLHRLKESRLKQQKEIERNIKNGLKEFTYPGGTVWALNQRNADKKALKLGLNKKQS